MSRWTAAEVRDLIALAPLGVEHIAWALQRTPKSVQQQAARLHISLKIGKEAADFASLRPDTKKRLMEMARAYMCPACGKRRASVKATGFCGPCHYDLVLELKQQELDVIAKRKKMDVLRQQKHRLRICESCGADFYPRPNSPDALCPGCRL